MKCSKCGSSLEISKNGVPVRVFDEMSCDDKNGNRHNA
jgi:hypothetical protein